VAAGQTSAVVVPPVGVSSAPKVSASSSSAAAAAKVAVAAAAAPALSTGIIVGIVIGALVFIALIAAIIVFVVWRRARVYDQNSMPDRTTSVNMAAYPVPMTPRSNTSDSRLDTNSARSTSPVWPQQSGAFVDPGFQKKPNPAYQMSTTDTYLQRKTVAATTGEIPLCSRCDEREATVDCSDCKSFFCHQCMLELHYSAESRWSGHSIQPFRLYT